MERIDYIIRNKILNETTTYCLDCRVREKCVEKECVVFRIEEIIEKFYRKYRDKLKCID